MTYGQSFKQLGDSLDQIEAGGVNVEQVDTGDGHLLDEGTIRLDVRVTLESIEQAASGTGARLHTPDGSEKLTADFALEVPVEGDEKTTENAETESTDEEQGDNSAATVDVTESRPDNGTSVGANNEDKPYYENEELLEQVYEEHDTFAEMTEALDVDVTPATVRQHMVNKGIHPDSSTDLAEESSSATSGDSREAPPIAEADGYGLPNDLSLDALVEAVAGARTFYEARTELGLDDDDARDLFADLDLLDLVTSRIARQDELETSPEDVRKRVRTAMNT